ncbi:MAG: CBS domain-containing protein [Bacteroidetes bacterium]|nr:CBS domain-containing protein [Bacteroidota bacterium]
MKKIIQILNRKGSNIIHIEPQLSVHDALQIMSDKNIGSLVVTQENQYLGIITERDYARKVMLKGKNSAETTVADIMTTDFPLLAEEDSIEKCMQLMTENNLRYLPVMRGVAIVGLISIMDVVQETILSQQETISELHQYISGSSY